MKDLRQHRILTFISTVMLVITLFLSVFSKVLAQPEVKSKLSEISHDGRFEVYENRTVLDTKTGLMWASHDSKKPLDWYSAKTYCKKYIAGEYKDWRMPTQNELLTIYDRNKTNRYGFKVTKFISITGVNQWTSNSINTQEAIIVYFGTGFFGGKTIVGRKAGPKTAGWQNLRVLPVRKAAKLD